MTTAGEPEPVLESALPEAPQTRDLLGNFCFYLHFAVMLFIVLGWLVPWWPVEMFYLVFLPGVAIQWLFNKNSCVLNNIESFMRTGSWRDPGNTEEGAWLLTLVRNVLRLPVTHGQMDAFTYSVLALLWLLGLGHFLRWAG
jgi:hypothetical protein